MESKNQREIQTTTTRSPCAFEFGATDFAISCTVRLDQKEIAKIMQGAKHSEAPATLRWGILSTGSIARVFAKGVRDGTTGVVSAVASRNLESAEQFASHHPDSECRAHSNYQALLEDANVDAIYIGTPHPQHVEWVIRAARAGKHILCEKPMGVNHAQVKEMIDAAREHRVFLMEAFMYRCHPQTHLVAELIRDRAIGEVAQIEASFGFTATVDPSHRLLNADLAGGGILDLGCYPISMARFVARLALGDGKGTMVEPDHLAGHGRIGDTGVDIWASALLKFPGGLSAQVSASVKLPLKNEVVIHGSEGRLLIPSPWHMNGTRSGPWQIQIQAAGKTEIEVIEHTESTGLYGLEADEVARCIEAGRLESPAMNWADSLGNALALDAWRREIGLAYPTEIEATFS